MSTSSITKLKPDAQDDLAVWDNGRIKWFDRVRRFGFIITDEDGSEVFLPWTSLQESNIPEHAMKIGTPVRYRCVPPDRMGGNPKATHVMLLTKPR